MKKIVEKKKMVMDMEDLSDEDKKEWIRRLDEAEGRTNALRVEFGEFYSQVNRIIFECDPIRMVTHEGGDDEYQGEAEDILDSIKGVSSQQDLESLVKSVFIENFYPGIVEKRLEVYQSMSEKIWISWRKYCEDRES